MPVKGVQQGDKRESEGALLQKTSKTPEKPGNTPKNSLVENLLGVSLAPLLLFPHAIPMTLAFRSFVSLLASVGVTSAAVAPAPR
jgi:hypothetical protein